MTCIVAMTKDGVIHLGADQVASDGFNLNNRSDPKIFIVKDFIFGFCGSYRMGQLLGYHFVPPARAEGKMDIQYIVMDVISTIRELFNTHGYARKLDSVEWGGTFILGYKGKVYVIEDDYQVSQPNYPYWAIGSGGNLALGALHALESLGDSIDLSVQERMAIGLRAAQEFNCHVRGPFLFEKLE